MGKRGRIACGIVLVLVCGLIGECGAESTLGFADALYAEGAYYESITEYLRYAYFFPEAPQVTHAWFRIGSAYERGGFPKKAEHGFLQASERATGETHLAVRLALARLYVRQERTDEAMAVYRDLLERPSARSGRIDIHLRCSLLAMQQFRVEKALEWAQLVYEPSAGQERIKIRGYIDHLQDPPLISYRSPGLARWISYVVPGSGQLYAGQYRRGLKAMLLNGVLGFVTFGLLADKLYLEAAGYYAIVWSRYHLGNALVAERAAEEYNRAVQRRYLDSLYRSVGLVEEIK